ncbi:hypothetical protein Taro_025482 [Colocasia esculenta]|uniref:Uncharacterized protein n=1 Tax=Colocasia esculenta TaxID=4460 RepID=A0A843VCD3_COLES|nr:hypothetical protein [Colocasia esculenta]
MMGPFPSADRPDDGASIEMTGSFATWDFCCQDNGLPFYRQGTFAVKTTAFHSTVKVTAFYSTVRMTAFYSTVKVTAFYSTIGVTAFYSTVRVTALY